MILRRFLGQLKKYPLFLSLSIISAFLVGTAGTLGHLFYGKSFDSILGKNDVNFPTLQKVLLIMIVFYVVEAVADRLLRRYSNRMAYRAVRDVRDQAFAKLSRLPLSYLDNHAHGDIISRFVGDMDSVSEAISLGMNSALRGVVLVTACLASMLFLSPKLTLIALFLTPLNFGVAFLTTKLTHNNFSAQQRVMGDLTGYVTENVGNEKTVFALGYEQDSIKAFSMLNHEYYQVSRKAQFASSLIMPSARFLDHLSYALLALVGGFLAISGEITVGTLTAFTIYLSQFTKPFNELTGITAQLQTAFASLERIFAFLDADEQEPDGQGAAEITTTKGEVTFTGVRFAYTPKKPLITNLTYQAKPGTLTAIVGPTGAGKTTLVNLLMRFYEIDDGQILLDGKNIKQMKRDDLRRQFGMVLQDSWLFSGTIADNIAYGKPSATREEVVEAAKSAYIHSFIKQLEQGYDTVISEDSDNLSGGQRQLLTIARIMLMDPPMLILDEATSSVDTLTELRIQKALDKIMEGRTSFVIAHRLSTIISADNILVMDQGDIVEQGNHNTLIAQNGPYAKLYYSQFQ